MLAIDRNICLACAGCVCVCPEMALYIGLDGLQLIDDDCTLCGICVDFCPVMALAVSEEEEQPVRQA